MAVLDDIKETIGLRSDHTTGGAASRGSSLLPGRGTLLGFALPLGLVALWQVASATGFADPQLLPAPGEVLGEIVALWQSGDLVEHIAVTMGRVAGGFLWGAVAATVLGILTGTSTWARQFLDPTIQALKAVPSLAWVPLFILWFGIFEDSKLMLIAVGVFFPVYLNLMTAIRDVDRKLIELARVNGLSRWQTVRWVLLPATLPAYVTGLRGGLALGWMFVVAAELMGASEGLGFLMIDGQMTGRPAIIIGALILFAIAGQITDKLLWLATRKPLAWQDTLDSLEGGRNNA
ncbi:MAG: ABC transporter permease [Alphaproteobacteria bacterium]|nr:ABC transporter permease [Alphaproteobacteria bacterium]